MMLGAVASGMLRRLRTAPINTVLPSISGAAASGQTLSASTGSWNNGHSAITGYAYQWNADGAPISGATSSTYLLTVDEIGTIITATVTATNAVGSTDATSAPTDEVVEGGAPEWLPDGAIAHLDFVAGNYYAGSAERAVDTLLGGGFDAGEISASGMLVNSANGNRPDAIGALFTDLVGAFAAGCTIVCEFDTTAKLDGSVISFHDSASGSYFDVYAFDVFFRDSPNFNLSLLDSGVGEQINVQGGAADQLSSGIQRSAFTIYGDIGGGSFESAGSVNGGTVFTDTSTYSAEFVPVTVELFHISGLSGFDDNIKAYIRSFTLYPAVASTDLPALAA